MNIVERTIDEVKPYEHNPRKNEAAVDYVANSISEFGWKVPIVIDRDGVIVAGHVRYKAAKKLKMKTLTCVLADDLTPEQVKAFRLADNKTGEIAEWDFALLDLELGDIADIDMRKFGFDPDMETAAVEDGYAPELPAIPKSRLGNLYALGRHKLLCGDSTLYDDVKKLVGETTIDMLLTDPPYNVDYCGIAGKIQNDHMESGSFRKFLAAAFRCAKLVLKPGGAFHIWYADSEGYNFRGACMDAGLTVRQQLIWVKNSATLGRQDFQHQYESVLAGERWGDMDDESSGFQPVLYGWQAGKAHCWFQQRKEKDVMFFDRPVASREHPTMKPIPLFDYEMRCNTVRQDNVLDLFGGSGTTIMAAEQNGRNAYVMEYDPRYADVIIDRWEKFTGQKAVLLHGEAAQGNQSNRI